MDLRGRIAALRRQAQGLLEEAARLEAMAENPPVLPAGFRVATVSDADAVAMKYNGEIPDLGSYIVVPADFPNRVRVVVESRGLRVEAGDGRMWFAQGWGLTPEEAIDEFLDE